MSTTLAYACDQCGRFCYPYARKSPTLVVCLHCDLAYDFAPWSYQEVTGAICLEMMYQKYVSNCRPQLLLAVDRKSWVKIPMMEFLEPSMLVLALQAGVQTSSELVMAQIQKNAQAEQLRRQLQLKRN